VPFPCMFHGGTITCALITGQKYLFCFHQQEPAPTQDIEHLTSRHKKATSNVHTHKKTENRGKNHFFFPDRVLESRSKPSYKPSSVVAQAYWMNHLPVAHVVQSQLLSLLLPA